MHIDIQKGRYVVAVSGGVDSMVLLDLLSKRSELHLIVAHFDHGIREDSAEDRRLVQRIAKELHIPFVYDEGQLGAEASEATARDARYTFLRKVQSQTHARAIITAHHQDDSIETAILNLLRGTGRKGVSALHDNPYVKRPLLKSTKDEIIEYAQMHEVKWREDSTNKDDSYKRNYIRQHIVPRMNTEQRQMFVQYIGNLEKLNKEIEAAMLLQLHTQSTTRCLDRRYFNMLPYKVSLECMAAWLRYAGMRSFDAKVLHRVVVFAKTLAPGRQIDIGRGYYIDVEDHILALKQRDR